MTSRQIFSELALFKKEVTERFLKVTRAIYENHPVYTYSNNESETKILIYPSYSDTESDGKQPRFIIKAGAYNYHLKDTLYDNMSREVLYKGAVAGYEHSQIINIPVTILIHAYAEEEASDLADELSSLVVYACRKMYSSVGLSVRGIQVSETDIFNTEQKIYQTSASVTLDVPWTTSTVDKGPPISDVVLTPEMDEVIRFSTYRSPGVTVFKEKQNNDD